MDKLDKKIEALGGLQNLAGYEIGKSEINTFFDKRGITLPGDLDRVISNYGGRHFIKEVVVGGLSEISLSNSEGNVPFSIFLGFIKGAFGVLEIMELISENLPKKYIPFGIADPTGDYWVYNLENGKVAYWQHDISKKESLHIVSNNLEDFILSFTANLENTKGGEITDYWIADDL